MVAKHIKDFNKFLYVYNPIFDNKAIFQFCYSYTEYIALNNNSMNHYAHANFIFNPGVVKNLFFCLNKLREILKQEYKIKGNI